MPTFFSVSFSGRSRTCFFKPDQTEGEIGSASLTIDNPLDNSNLISLVSPNTISAGLIEATQSGSATPVWVAD
jgi:hypothetical protein